jgi:hypothetical protein
LESIAERTTAFWFFSGAPGHPCYNERRAFIGVFAKQLAQEKPLLLSRGVCTTHAISEGLFGTVVGFFQV